MTIPTRIPFKIGASEPVTSRIVAYFTAVEKAALVTKAKRAGLSLSSYVRNRLTF